MFMTGPHLLLLMCMFEASRENVDSLQNARKTYVWLRLDAADFFNVRYITFVHQAGLENHLGPAGSNQ